MQQMSPEGSMLQCQGELTKKISFKPSNVLSKAHRTLTLAVRKRAVKGSRIQKYAETIDPEQVCRWLFNYLEPGQFFWGGFYNLEEILRACGLWS